MDGPTPRLTVTIRSWFGTATWLTVTTTWLTDTATYAKIITTQTPCATSTCVSYTTPA